MTTAQIQLFLSELKIERYSIEVQMIEVEDKEVFSDRIFPVNINVRRKGQS